MKYPIIVVGGVRYVPYALMEMQGDEVTSFKPIKESKPNRFLNALLAIVKGSACRRGQQCHASTSRF